MSSERIKQIQSRFEELEQEKKNLATELQALQAKARAEPPPLLGLPVREKSPESPEEKIALFLTLFSGRKSVFPKLWENQKKGSKGYSPACRNEWITGTCEKPRIKCGDCNNQAFYALDEKAVKEHLQGIHTIGTYAIRENDTCTFLATDFDGEGWKEDISAYKLAARDLGVSVEIERSRSGNGGHAWIFFSDPIPARMARQLGTIIVSRACALKPAISLETFDRFFPNQDFLPKGGFGNLIALPLQKIPREKGNTALLNDQFVPVEDQWQQLSQARRLSPDEIKSTLIEQDAGPRLFFTQYENEEVASAEKALDAGSHKIVPGSYAEQIVIEADSQLSIGTLNLPAPIYAAFKRTATFANPKFFELERLRFSTWKTPRFIFCGEVQPASLILPRGSYDACLEIAKIAGSNLVIRDTKPDFTALDLAFNGNLSSVQEKALSAFDSEEIGVLVAPPGAGKTVMGCALIAKRKLPTLILVHRMPLLEQWRQQLTAFLNINLKEIGSFGAQKKKQLGKVDIGMLQTFAKMENAEELLKAYGQIIIDECHHIPAISFETVLKKCRARYVLGLTATPYRKDGHQAIIHMQCGPIRHEMAEASSMLIEKKVIIRETSFRMPPESPPQPPIHEVWERLVTDPNRLLMVAEDLKASLEANRFTLVISERKQHLELLAEAFQNALSGLNAKSFLLVGGLGKKVRAKILDEINAAIQNRERFYILATGSFIGEGFDLPVLDTLLIAMPVSFKGKLIQYAGRLNRISENKKDILIYDYLDAASGLTVSMFKKRLAAYKKMGYQIETEPDGKAERLVFSSVKKPNFFGSMFPTPKRFPDRQS